jgi:hypothetical protein
MYKLVLVRHGESLWNKENRFTGWYDVDLSEKGKEEAKKAGQALKKEGYTFDVAFSSVLKRAIRTLQIVLDEMDLMWIPVNRSWKLNERHYGALQGLNKSETAAKFGEPWSWSAFPSSPSQLSRRSLMPRVASSRSCPRAVRSRLRRHDGPGVHERRGHPSGPPGARLGRPGGQEGQADQRGDPGRGRTDHRGCSDGTAQVLAPCRLRRHQQERQAGHDRIPGQGFRDAYRTISRVTREFETCF